MIILFALVALFLILHLNLPREGQATASRSSLPREEIEYAYTGRLPARLRARQNALPPFLVRSGQGSLHRLAA